ncbi:MAG: hypothetical protein ACYC91_03740 [Solirubrobacteraceae bacterium]
MSPSRQPRSWTIPGHPLWRARRVQSRGRTIAIRARHRLLPWQTITVETRDLRAGAEAVARHLQSESGARRPARGGSY